MQWGLTEAIRRHIYMKFSFITSKTTIRTNPYLLTMISHGPNTFRTNIGQTITGYSRPATRQGGSRPSTSMGSRPNSRAGSRQAPSRGQTGRVNWWERDDAAGGRQRTAGGLEIRTPESRRGRPLTAYSGAELKHDSRCLASPS